MPALADRTVDAQGRVSTGNANMDLLLGPILATGYGPWPWFDSEQQAFADTFGALQSTDYAPYWNTPQAGTVSIALNGTAVAGSGTSLQTVFCDGGSSPNGKAITFWYVVGSGSGRHSYAVGSCTDETHITLAGGAWGTFVEPTQTNIQFSTETEVQQGTWVNGSSNVNYYDNVLAFYSMYYRSGLTAYRDYARTLADRWWTQPNIDEGRAVGQARTVAPRLLAFSGLVARALDGRPEMWAGLEAYADQGIEWSGGAGELSDIRENGYSIARVALAAMFDPNSGKRASYLASLATIITTRWGPNQQPNGQWRMYSWGPSPYNGNPGTATVTHGSTTVTGVGTSWPSYYCSGNYSQFWVSNVDTTGGDPVSYTCTWVSGTQITLDRPYEGTSASGKGWEFYLLVGYGTQPFMMGIVGTAMNWSYLALNAAGSPLAPTVKQYVLNAADWLMNYGYPESTRGLYYGRDFANCEPITTGNPFCGSAADAESRFLNGEVMNVFSSAYQLSAQAKYKTAGDDLFSAMWAHSAGQIGYDGIDIGSEVAYALAIHRAKDFGFLWGIGMGGKWPAARLGPANTAAAPTFDPPAGTYSSSQSVTISTATGGATIRYTVDGSTPSESMGAVYGSPVSVSSTQTLKAIAYKSGLDDSSVMQAAYTITVAPPPSGAGTSISGSVMITGYISIQ